MSLVGVFISVSTFTGEAEAKPALAETCPTENSQPPFQNPRFIYADYGKIALDATSRAFKLGDKNFNGRLYDATFYDNNGSVQEYGPLYNPPTIRVSPGNTINQKLINDLPLDSPLGVLPLTEQNLENVSQDTNLHYHGFNVSPLLGSDNVVMHLHSNITPKAVSLNPGDTVTIGTQQPVSVNNGDKLQITNDPSTTNSKAVDLLTTGDGSAAIPVGSDTNTTGGDYPLNNPSPTYFSPAPITEYQMQVNLPYGHQSGLFWYHPHVHTSSNSQVRGGMSGGIIVEGMEKSYSIIGGIRLAQDTTLRDKKYKSGTTPRLTEQVMLFKDFNNQFGTTDDPDTTNNYDCFTLNGAINPNVTIGPGEVQFWRIGNIGADNYLNLQLLDISKIEPFCGKRV